MVRQKCSSMMDASRPGLRPSIILGLVRRRSRQRVETGRSHRDKLLNTLPNPYLRVELLSRSQIFQSVSELPYAWLLRLCPHEVGLGSSPCDRSFQLGEPGGQGLNLHLLPRNSALLLLDQLTLL